MKILFISIHIDCIPMGAHFLALAHREALKGIAGHDGVHTVSIADGINMKPKSEDNKIILISRRTHLDSVKNIIAGNIAGYSLKAEDNILGMIDSGDYDLVWFDVPAMGSTVQKIKHQYPELPVYVFWHSVSGKNSLWKTDFSLLGLGRRLSSVREWEQRKISARYADANIVLNQRDSGAFSEIYGHDADLMLPVSFIDTANIVQVLLSPDKFSILFVGGGGTLSKR